MTDTSLKIRPDRPLDPLTLAIIQEIIQVSRTLGFDVFLVGATARSLILENVFGLSPGRATRDVDFAFALENWEQFHHIKQQLISTSRFQESAGATQRLLYRMDGMKHPFIVDLIPFGDIEDNPNRITWPPDMSVIMNVAGYRDVLATAILVEVSPAQAIRVASLAGISILKLFAWSDRGQIDPKDAIDFVTLLRGYNAAGNLDRLYEEGLNALESSGYDVELAGAWLLGHDASKIASSQTRTELITLLNEGKTPERLVQDMARGLRGQEDALDYSRALRNQFLEGFQT